MFLIISNIYKYVLKEKLFLYGKNEGIFIHMRSKKDKMLNFQNWVFNDPFNQITLENS